MLTHKKLKIKDIKTCKKQTEDLCNEDMATDYNLNSYNRNTRAVFDQLRKCYHAFKVGSDVIRVKERLSSLSLNCDVTGWIKEVTSIVQKICSCRFIS